MSTIICGQSQLMRSKALRSQIIPGWRFACFRVGRLVRKSRSSCATNVQGYVHQHQQELFPCTVYLKIVVWFCEAKVLYVAPAHRDAKSHEPSKDVNALRRLQLLWLSSLPSPYYITCTVLRLRVTHIDQAQGHKNRSLNHAYIVHHGIVAISEGRHR